MDINTLFRLGMKRELPPLLDPLPEMITLNLGAGNSRMAGAHNLDEPAWNGNTDPIPFGNKKVGGIFAFHFLEHLVDPRVVLRECERVLAPGAPLTIVVPHAWGTMAFQDLDHKKFFVLDTWQNMMNSEYYDVNKRWQFRIQFNAVVGIAERNLALLTQLAKTD